MREDAIRELIRDISPNTKIEKYGEWVKTSCPLSHWRHESGTDRSGSFGIHIEQNDRSFFNCFTCGSKGTVRYLVELLSQLRGVEIQTGVDYETEEYYGGSIPEWEDQYEPKINELGDPLPLNTSRAFLPVRVHPYLTEREIDEQTATDCELLLDNKDHRICFPVYSRNGDLYGYNGRDYTGNSRIKSKDYMGLPKRMLLLGSHRIPEDAPYICLVEGAFDYARLVQYEVPVVCGLHAKLTEVQMDILVDIGKPIVWFGDNDKAGWEGLNKLVKYLKDDSISISSVDWGDVDKENSDPDMLTYEEVQIMLDNRTLVDYDHG